MKRISCLVIVFSLIANAGYGQGFYFRAGLGYALPQAGQTLDGTATPYNGTLNNTTQAIKIKGASFSAGFSGTVGFGYMLNKNLGVQLDANLGIANKKYTFTESNVMIGGVPSTVDFVQEVQSPIIISPSLVLQTGSSPWNIYSRLGLALPLHSTIKYDQIQSNNAGTGVTTVYDFTFLIKSSFSLGFTGAAGVQYKLNDRLNVWGEVSILSLSLYTKQADLTDFQVNGQSQSLSYVNGSHTISYSKNAVLDTSGAIQPAYSQPFSNVGVNFGISVNIGGSRRSGSSHARGTGNNNELIDRPRRGQFK